MERDAAIDKLKLLLGKDLHSIAKEFGISALSEKGRVNKGWAGHACERYLGLQINSAQSPNFGSWELKSIPLKRDKFGKLRFKETMAITMIDPFYVERTPFKDSHLLAKLNKAVCVVRIVGPSYEHPTIVHSIATFDLTPDVLTIVKADYELVQDCLKDKERGFSALTGKMGRYIQPRTKGAGHGSISRAFYARPIFLSQFINLEDTAR